jgi:hypothetical protein
LPANYPVLGSIPNWPETYMTPLCTVAVEYGPIAYGPFFVLILNNFVIFDILDILTNYI